MSQDPSENVVLFKFNFNLFNFIIFNLYIFFIHELIILGADELEELVWIANESMSPSVYNGSSNVNLLVVLVAQGCRTELSDFETTGHAVTLATPSDLQYEFWTCTESCFFVKNVRTISDNSGTSDARLMLRQSIEMACDNNDFFHRVDSTT